MYRILVAQLLQGSLCGCPVAALGLQVSLGQRNGQLRLGLTFRNFTFGAGSNIDYYGPQRVNKNTYGGFLKIDV